MGEQKMLYVVQINLIINKQEVQYIGRLRYGKISNNFFKCKYEDFDDFCLDCNKEPLDKMCMIIEVPRLLGNDIIREVSFSVGCNKKPKKVTEKNFKGATLEICYRVISEEDYTLTQLANMLIASEFFEYCKDNLHIKGG